MQVSWELGSPVVGLVLERVALPHQHNMMQDTALERAGVVEGSLEVQDTEVQVLVVGVRCLY